jgi:predicted dehydrogenase
MSLRHVVRPPSGGDPLVATGPSLRWGVVATGHIARCVVAQLVQLQDAELVAVSSRDAERARAFAAEFGASRAYGDADGASGFRRLADDPEVDVVYVASPHGQHHEVARSLLEGGKHVLVEKPFTVTAAEAGDLIDLARGRGAFLMEAVWTRFLPLYQQVVDVVTGGEIGRVRWLQADLGFPAPIDPRSRMWAPEAGGGALLDLAVYPLSWAVAVLGFPPAWSADAVVLPDLGVDGLTALTLAYPGEATAQLTCTLLSRASRSVTIGGHEATLRTWAPLTNPAGFTIEGPSGRREVRAPASAAPYAWMLREVTRCVQQGLSESPTMPLDHTLATMRMFDDVRRRIGVRYPNDVADG